MLGLGISVPQLSVLARAIAAAETELQADDGTTPLHADDGTTTLTED